MRYPSTLDRTKPMIKDLKNSVPIEQTLLIVYTKMGLKPDNWPSKDPKFNEHQLLITHIRENYRTIRAEEIKLAFELALKGKFNVDTQHYQNFSCEYFSRVMNAYLKYRAGLSPKREQLPPPKKENPLKRFYELYDNLKKGDAYMFNGMEWLYYKHLEDSGVEIMSVERKKELFNQVKKETPRKLKESQEDWNYRIKKECRKIAFKEFVTESAFNNVNLER